MNLRDSLLAALRTLQGTREFHIHVLVTAPKKNGALYPYAIPRPRLYAQGILILLSEQDTPDTPRVLVSAIEACLYNSPTTSSAILYVGKVDSTGQGMAPSPTATLVKAFVRWYADPETRPLPAQHLWVHLFARAQGQYLFPNSADFEGKKPLSDLKLCAWWHRVLGAVAQEVQGGDVMREAGRVRLYFLLPGYSELEALQALRSSSLATPSSSAAGPTWTYGHPYSQTDVPLPCPPPPTGVHNLGHIIPSFEDDPKNRFMDEIAYLTDADAVRSPARKRQRLASNSERTTEEKEHATAAAKEERPKGELDNVQPDEFWERMSFRQECVAGAVTGFFVAVFSAPPPTGKPVSRPSGGGSVSNIISNINRNSVAGPPGSPGRSMSPPGGAAKGRRPMSGLVDEKRRSFQNQGRCRGGPWIAMRRITLWGRWIAGMHDDRAGGIYGLFMLVTWKELRFQRFTDAERSMIFTR
ncbi:hypothetical protein EWM64_g6647 [Hericium alpestre]|uniref:histone acetyltransferase n=1 Tax=Hericium alpestre TaxID=135208 RepID=A0A4Y9ZR55_9AGAM|nr:hypothetical protein EWM64_g6647 [Hericium alpestre]